MTRNVTNRKVNPLEYHTEVPELPLAYVLVEGAEFTWMRDANCLDAPSDMFMAAGGKTRGYQAKRTCNACVVRAECLEYALLHKLELGVFGGLNERERRLEKYKRAREAKRKDT